MSIGAFSWDTSPQEAGDSRSPTIKDNSLTLATCDKVGWAIWWSGIQIFFFGGKRAESVLSTDGKGGRKIVVEILFVDGLGGQVDMSGGGMYTQRGRV